MTERQRTAAKERHQREAEVCCPLCDGSGRILSRTVKARAKKGGNAAYLKSLQPEQMSMSERGKLGGAPRLPTWEDLEAGRRQKRSSDPEGLASTTMPVSRGAE